MMRKYSEVMVEAAEAIIKKVYPLLDAQDRAVLTKDGPRILRQVQSNVRLKKKPLEDLTEAEKKVLLAYVVFFRQNVTTCPPKDRSNEEDASRILHGEIYNKDKDKKRLEDDLIDQLEKLGIDMDTKESNG